MKNLKYLVVGSLLLALAMIATASSISLSREQQSSEHQKLKEEEQAALEIVQKYFSLSSEGNFEGVSQFTIPVPKSAQKEQPSPSPEEKKEDVPPGTAVVTRAGSGYKLQLSWVREEFPRSVYEQKDRIVKLDGIVVSDQFAKVSVNLGNDQVHSLLPWVFMLARSEDGKSWKIYDIKTPAYAVDYKP
jgi:hypothetical protein